VDGANHGDRLKDDPRRHLYKEFLRYVEHLRPNRFESRTGCLMLDMA
jgi:site-specific DNA-cytosine methylase